MAYNKNPVAKIAFFSLLVLLAGGIVLWWIFEPPCVDETTGCPCLLESGHTEVTLSVLLDATDPYGAAQQRSIVDAVWDEVDALAVYDRVKVYTVRQKPVARGPFQEVPRRLT